MIKDFFLFQDVFTVSVGNLPPKATVLIKITYVAELQVDGELINFQIPGSVAPWKKDSTLNEKLQVQFNRFSTKSATEGGGLKMLFSECGGKSKLYRKNFGHFRLWPLGGG